MHGYGITYENGQEATDISDTEGSFFSESDVFVKSPKKCSKSLS